MGTMPGIHSLYLLISAPWPSLWTNFPFFLFFGWPLEKLTPVRDCGGWHHVQISPSS